VLIVHNTKEILYDDGHFVREQSTILQDVAQASSCELSDIEAYRLGSEETKEEKKQKKKNRTSKKKEVRIAE
jgi:hypothetical protein